MPKMTTKFDNAKVARLKLPQDKSQCDWFENLFEGRSLILTVNLGGTRSWSVLYYEKGKPRRKRLGAFPEMGTREARKAAREFDVQAAITSAKAGSFKEVAEKWFKRHVEENKLRSRHELRRHLETYIYPRWAARQFAEIRRADVNDLLDHIVDRHGKAQADAVLATIRSICNWYQTRDDEYVSPIVPKMKRNKTPNIDGRVEKRWLNDDEIRALWKASGEAGSFGSILRLALLTGQRREKIATMKWVDIDLEKGEWRIAREPREKGTPRAITLPSAALEIVENQPMIAGSPYVFFGRGKKKHFNSWSQRKAEIDQKLPRGMPSWVIHDLRRTARKLMTRMKVPLDVAELALGHSIRGIRATYDDVEEYRPAIDDALVRIAAEISRILNPENNVIAFPR